MQNYFLDILKILVGISVLEVYGLDFDLSRCVTKPTK